MSDESGPETDGAPRPLKGAVLISGGASGLGEATARRLHSAGMTVCIFDRDEGRARAIADELGDRAMAVAGDVTHEDSMMSAARTAADADRDGLRLSVSCAGIFTAAGLLSKRGPHDVPDFKRNLDVNLLGTFLQIRAAAAVMAENEERAGERGLIVVTSSIAANDGPRGTLAYAASKAGVAGMILPAARDLGRHKIRVCGIAPGNFQTPMTAADPPEVTDALTSGTPHPRRLGNPDEFARTVEFMAGNQMVNGSVFRIDGGLRLS